MHARMREQEVLDATDPQQEVRPPCTDPQKNRRMDPTKQEPTHGSPTTMHRPTEAPTKGPNQTGTEPRKSDTMHRPTETPTKGPNQTGTKPHIHNPNSRQLAFLSSILWRQTTDD